MAVTVQNIVKAALETLVVDGVDVGATYEQLVVAVIREKQLLEMEEWTAPFAAVETDLRVTASVTLAEITMANLAIVWSLPAASIVSSSITINSTDRDLIPWIATGKPGSGPDDTVRVFNFPLSCVIGNVPTNLAKTEDSRLPIEFAFYANVDTGLIGTITDMAIVYLMPRSEPIALDGAQTIQYLYTAESNATIRSIRVIYEEASSSDAGVAVRIGKIGDPEYFGTYTTAISQSIGTVANVTLLATDLDAGETLTVECDGGKDGTGVISVQVGLKETI